MHCLIVDDDPGRQAELTMTLMRSGFQVTPTSSQKVAETCIRRGFVDLVLMAERVGGRLTHSLALLAELKNPMVATILLTARTDTDVEELFLLLPSLHCMLAPDADAALVGKLALASVSGAGTCDKAIVLPPSTRIDGEQPSWVLAPACLSAPPANLARASQVA